MNNGKLLTSLIAIVVGIGAMYGIVASMMGPMQIQMQALKEATQRDILNLQTQLDTQSHRDSEAIEKTIAEMDIKLQMEIAAVREVVEVQLTAHKNTFMHPGARYDIHQLWEFHKNPARSGGSNSELAPAPSSNGAQP